jgi:uncharacterized protein YbjT (DUF2867 family)
VAEPHTILVTGGTGYLGRALIPALLRRGHAVRALVRPSSTRGFPAGTELVLGDALDVEAVAGAIGPADTLVHLVGTPRPSPAKAAQFRLVDLASIRAAAAAAQRARLRHLVYVSVAHPAPVMKAYVMVRQEGEALVRASGVPATVLRPWYVLGPGHWWPSALLPVYAVLRRVPTTRAGAERLGLVTRGEMIAALVRAVENPPTSLRVVEVPEIRTAAAQQ